MGGGVNEGRKGNNQSIHPFIRILNGGEGIERGRGKHSPSSWHNAHMMCMMVMHNLCCCCHPRPCPCPRRLSTFRINVASSHCHCLAQGGGRIILREGGQRRGGCQWGVKRERLIDQSIHWNVEGREGYGKKWR
jgi:hypothetical protein